MKRLGLGFGLRLAASLAVAASVVVPLAAVGTSVARRHLQLNHLGSPDPALREQALNVLIREADQDPRWLDGAARRLASLPDDAVVPLINAIQMAGVQDQSVFYAALADHLPRLSDAVFLAVASPLKTAAPIHRDAVINEALSRLRSAADEDSRQPWIVLLDTVQAWATPPVPAEFYVPWLARGVEAEQPALRIHTARQLGDLPIRQPQIDVRLVTAPLRRLLTDDDPDVRQAALWALAGYVPRDPAFVGDLRTRAADDPAPHIRDQAARLLRVWSQNTSIDPTPIPAQATDVKDVLTVGDWPQVLAVLDTYPAAALDLPFDQSMPHHVRIAATRASRLAVPGWLIDTLRVNDRPALRDVAVVVLADRFSPDQLEPWVRELLHDHDPDARLSGAVLSGLIGRASDALKETLRHERRESARIVMKVALWMQGQLPELDTQVPALLGSEHLPESTLLLAMLHVGQQRAALDRLLGLGANQPLGQNSTPPRTITLFRAERWIIVLHRHLPADAPRLPLHAADPTFAEDLANLRAWHALYRFD